MENLEPLANEARAAIAAADDGATLEQLRVDYLGKKGQITALLKGLGKLSAEDRPKAGALINVVKQELQGLIGDRKASLESAAASTPGEFGTFWQTDVTIVNTFDWKRLSITVGLYRSNADNSNLSTRRSPTIRKAVCS